MAPIPTYHLPTATPDTLSLHTGEEDVIRVFGGTAQGAKAGPRAIAFANLHPRRDPTADPLPHKDPNFQRQADGPNRRLGEGTEEGAMAE